MPGITDALISSANHLRSLEQSMGVIQKNVANASTPGYARRDMTGVEQPSNGETIHVTSSRDEYAEHAVRRQLSLLGRFDQLHSMLRLVEPGFGVGEEAAIPRGLSNLFNAFSSLSANPNDARLRQIVLDRAAQLARGFNGAARTLAETAGESRRQVTAAVEAVNRIAAEIAGFNRKQREMAGGAPDSGLYAALEELAEFAEVQTLRQSDGALTVLLGGQTPLVIGGEAYPIGANVTSSPAATIHDASGADITALARGGRLGGALEAVNVFLPRYQAGLDQLAQGVADAVNAALAGGVDAAGNPGAALFTYQPPNAAATLSFSGIAPSQLAAAVPGAPGGNGNALALAALEAAASVAGLSFAGFYGALAAGAGRDVAEARDSRAFQTQLAAQARAQRSEVSGVSLDREAIRLVEYQRAYQAAAKMVSVLDELTEAALNMIR
jgi:flagellar hook-associated protein 1 FlgK